MYSAQVRNVLRILGSPHSYLFQQKSDIEAVRATADAGLCRHEVRDKCSIHILKEPHGWSKDGVAVVLTELGMKELEKLDHSPLSA